MKLPIHTVSELGMAVRAVRKEQGLRQDDTAGSAGVGHVFLRDVERGKETVQLGLVLKVLDELGIRLSIDIPSDAMSRFKELHEKGPTPAGRGKTSP